MNNINPNTIVFILFWTLVGGLFGNYLIGATIATGLVLAVSVLQ